MGGLIVLGLIVAAVAIIDIIALNRGVDSRPGFEDPRAASGELTV
ncbi:MAG TPA: hypothetical protein VEX41_04960 [Candidatus Eisenbacteria bacterium]|nr:hypothetical protein [Candidatus Eisenbacteria bacterium]